MSSGKLGWGKAEEDGEEGTLSLWMGEKYAGSGGRSGRVLGSGRGGLGEGGCWVFWWGGEERVDVDVDVEVDI